MEDANKIPFSSASLTHLLIEVFLLMHVAILPLLMREFDLSIVQAGLIVTLPNLVRITLNFPMGIVADKVNPRYLLSLSSLLSGLGALLISQTTSITFLVLGLCLLMTSVSMYHPPGMSLISKTFSEKKLTKMMGIHGASGNIGQALGIFSLSVSMSIFGWRYSYLVWAIPLLIWGALLITLFSDAQFKSRDKVKTNNDEATTEQTSIQDWREGFRHLLKTRNFLVVLLVMSLFGLGYYGVLSFTTTFFVQVRGLSEELAALFFGIVPVVGIIGSLSGGYVGQKVGNRNFLALTFMGLAVSLLSLTFSPWIVVIIFAFLFFRWLSSSVWPSSSALIQNFSPQKSRGMAYSTYYGLAQIFGALSPFMMSIVIENSNFICSFMVALGLFLVGSGTMCLLQETD